MLLFVTQGRIDSDQPPKIKLLHKAATAIISDEQSIPSGVHVGVVEFESSTRTLKELTELDILSTREDIANAVPDDVHGGTGIGDGILKGIEVCVMLMVSALKPDT